MLAEKTIRFRRGTIEEYEEQRDTEGVEPDTIYFATDKDVVHMFLGALPVTPYTPAENE